MDAYRLMGTLAEGAHGLVLRAKHTSSGRAVALKKIPLRRLDQGLPLAVVREIKALQLLRNKYVREDKLLRLPTA